MLITENYKSLKLTSSKLQSFDNNASDPVSKYLPTTKKNKGFWKFFKGILDDFVENCTIPGLDRIFENNLNALKRFLWLCGFSLAIAIFSYVTTSIANIQKTNPMVTVVSATHYPIYKIPFPVITICNKNRLNWQRYDPAKENFLKPQHQSDEYEDIFKDVLNAYDTLTFGEFNKFENLLDIPSAQLEELNYVNFTVVVEFMAWKCSEIFSECKWLNQNYNCCDIFFMRKSQMGACLAFNTVESEGGIKKQSLDHYWPWRTKGMGIESGLRVKVHIHEKLHAPQSTNAKGIEFMLTEPYVWYYIPMEVGTHTETTVSFLAKLHYFDEHTRYYSPKIRQCLFENELKSKYYKSLPGFPYMYENCLAECQQEYLIEFCNCTMDLFYPPGRFKACKLSDLPCLYKHKDKLQYFEQIGESDYVFDNRTNKIKCLCYLNCKSLTYFSNINAAHMANVESEVNNTFIDITFFSLRDHLMVFQTTVTYTWTDLMAGIGGLAGLCIGCSLISVIELLYFLLLDIPKRSFHYFKSQQYYKLRRKSSVINKIFVNTSLRK